MKVLTFGIDNRALLDLEGHSKRWNRAMGAYVDRLDVIVEGRERRGFSKKWLADNVCIIPIYVPHPLLYSFIAYKVGLREHRYNYYDLITSEDPFRTGLAAIMFKRKTGAPLIVEYHTETFYNKDWLRDRLNNRIYNIIGRIAINYADAVRCVNEKNIQSKLKNFVMAQK